MVKRLSAKEIEMELELDRQIKEDVNKKEETSADEKNWLDYEKKQVEEQYERKFYY